MRISDIARILLLLRPTQRLILYSRNQQQNSVVQTLCRRFLVNDERLSKFAFRDFILKNNKKTTKIIHAQTPYRN